MRYTQIWCVQVFLYSESFWNAMCTKVAALHNQVREFVICLRLRTRNTRTRAHVRYSPACIPVTLNELFHTILRMRILFQPMCRCYAYIHVRRSVSAAHLKSLRALSHLPQSMKYDWRRSLKTLTIFLRHRSAYCDCRWEKWSRYVVFHCTALMAAVHSLHTRLHANNALCT